MSNKKDVMKKEVGPVITDPNTGKSYARGKFLGKGGFARCYELTDPLTKRIYAGKIVSKSLLTKPHQKAKMSQEISIHRSLSHKNIVGFHGFFEDPENVYIILELCRRRSLMELHKRRKAITEPETRYFLRHMLLGVKHLHDHKVIHRDLKLGNLFINDDMELKIGDFGLATKVGFEGERKRTLCGTPNYIAPEILCKKGHSYEVDVWSIGCILYTLLVGKPPFETQTLQETYSRIKKNEYIIPSRIAPLAKSLIEHLLQEDPSKRPTVDDILSHDFMTMGFIPARLPTSCLTMAPRFDAHLNGSIVATRKPLLELNTNGVGNLLGDWEGSGCTILTRKSDNQGFRYQTKCPTVREGYSEALDPPPFRNITVDSENFGWYDRSRENQYEDSVSIESKTKSGNESNRTVKNTVICNVDLEYDSTVTDIPAKLNPQNILVSSGNVIRVTGAKNKKRKYSYDSKPARKRLHIEPVSCEKVVKKVMIGNSHTAMKKESHVSHENKITPSKSDLEIIGRDQTSSSKRAYITCDNNKPLILEKDHKILSKHMNLSVDDRKLITENVGSGTPVVFMKDCVNELPCFYPSVKQVFGDGKYPTMKSEPEVTENNSAIYKKEAKLSGQNQPPTQEINFCIGGEKFPIFKQDSRILTDNKVNFVGDEAEDVTKAPQILAENKSPALMRDSESTVTTEFPTGKEENKLCKDVKLENGILKISEDKPTTVSKEHEILDRNKFPILKEVTKIFLEGNSPSLIQKPEIFNDSKPETLLKEREVLGDSPTQILNEITESFGENKFSSVFAKSENFDEAKYQSVKKELKISAERSLSLAKELETFAKRAPCIFEPMNCLENKSAVLGIEPEVFVQNKSSTLKGLENYTEGKASVRVAEPHDMKGHENYTEDKASTLLQEPVVFVKNKSMTLEPENHTESKSPTSMKEPDVLVDNKSLSLQEPEHVIRNIYPSLSKDIKMTDNHNDICFGLAQSTFENKFPTLKNEPDWLLVSAETTQQREYERVECSPTALNKVFDSCIKSLSPAAVVNEPATCGEKEIHTGIGLAIQSEISSSHLDKLVAGKDLSTVLQTCKTTVDNEDSLMRTNISDTDTVNFMTKIDFSDKVSQGWNDKSLDDVIDVDVPAGKANCGEESLLGLIGKSTADARTFVTSDCVKERNISDPTSHKSGLVGTKKLLPVFQLGPFRNYSAQTNTNSTVSLSELPSSFNITDNSESCRTEQIAGGLEDTCKRKDGNFERSVDKKFGLLFSSKRRLSFKTPRRNRILHLQQSRELIQASSSQALQFSVDKTNSYMTSAVLTEKCKGTDSQDNDSLSIKLQFGQEQLMTSTPIRDNDKSTVQTSFSISFNGRINNELVSKCGNPEIKLRVEPSLLSPLIGSLIDAHNVISPISEVALFGLVCQYFMNSETCTDFYDDFSSNGSYIDTDISYFKLVGQVEHSGVSLSRNLQRKGSYITKHYQSPSRSKMNSSILNIKEENYKTLQGNCSLLMPKCPEQDKNVFRQWCPPSYDMFDKDFPTDVCRYEGFPDDFIFQSVRPLEKPKSGSSGLSYTVDIKNGVGKNSTSLAIDINPGTSYSGCELKAEDISLSEFELLDSLSNTAKDVVSNVEDVLTSVEDVLAPVEDVLTPVEDVLTPVEDVLTPVEDVLTPVGDVLASDRLQWRNTGNAGVDDSLCQLSRCEDDNDIQLESQHMLSLPDCNISMHDYEAVGSLDKINNIGDCSASSFNIDLEHFDCDSLHKMLMDGSDPFLRYLENSRSSLQGLEIHGSFRAENVVLDLAQVKECQVNAADGNENKTCDGKAEMSLWTPSSSSRSLIIDESFSNPDSDDTSDESKSMKYNPKKRKKKATSKKPKNFKASCEDGRQIKQISKSHQSDLKSMISSVPENNPLPSSVLSLKSGEVTSSSRNKNKAVNSHRKYRKHSKTDTESTSVPISQPLYCNWMLNRGSSITGFDCKYLSVYATQEILDLVKTRVRASDLDQKCPASPASSGRPKKIVKCASSASKDSRDLLKEATKKSGKKKISSEAEVPRSACPKSLWRVKYGRGNNSRYDDGSAKPQLILKFKKISK